VEESVGEFVLGEELGHDVVFGDDEEGVVDCLDEEGVVDGFFQVGFYGFGVEFGLQYQCHHLLKVFTTGVLQSEPSLRFLCRHHNSILFRRYLRVCIKVLPFILMAVNDHGQVDCQMVVIGRAMPTIPEAHTERIVWRDHLFNFFELLAFESETIEVDDVLLVCCNMTVLLRQHYY
jgi:hypothetical protein